MRFALLPAALLSLCLAVGCAPRYELQLVSYKDPYFPETLQLSPSDCAWRQEHGGDIHIVARSSDLVGEPPVAVEQYLHARLFWRPRPGKTPVDSGTINANLRFVVMTDRGVSEYEGTGFVFVKKFEHGKPADVRLESSALKPVRTSGTAPELFGEIRLTGRMKAAADESTALDLVRRAEVREAGVEGARGRGAE